MRNRLLFVWYRYIGAIFRLLPICKGRIVFQNFFGKGYGDNPKYIAQEIMRRNQPGLELIWLVKNNTYLDMPACIRQVKRGTLSELYYLATAHIWVDNARKHYGVQKRNGQFYFQTWHGGIAGKKVEADILETLTPSYVKSAIHDSEQADLFVSCSRWNSENYRTAFWYKGKILECGLPRSDLFYAEKSEIRAKVFRFYNLNPEDKILLYAPTFRENGNTECYHLEYQNLRRALEKRFGGCWKILIRLHPNIADKQNFITYSETELNGTSYSDINELIVAGDILLTDYSGCMFDAMEAQKTVLLYAPDVQDYMRHRGSYFPVETLPFTLACSNEALVTAIELFDEEQYKTKCTRFLEERIGSFNDGHASENAVDYLFKQTGLQQ